MFEWLFGKKEVHKVREEAKKGFDAVKKDINAVSGWIKHLDSERTLHRKELDEIKGILSTIQEDVESLKGVISVITGMDKKGVFKQLPQVFNKQTGVYAVQTPVQTGVQTPNLNQFSMTERAILWVLLNTDMKLSYDDLAAMLGKDKSTVRGQINRIKQKNESLIEEITEKNGKKRIYIPEIIKDNILKKVKVRVKKPKNLEKSKK